MKREIKILYLKIFILTLPFLAIVLSYVVIDPFGIFYKTNPISSSSDDYLTTELYLKNTKSINYNAFVFGNSKTLAFLSSDWQKVVKDSLVAFKFGCPGECIFNIYNKIKLIKENNYSLKHVLIVLDEAVFKNFKNTSKNYSGPVYKHHWLTCDENRLEYYGSYFKFYLQNFNFIKMIDYSIFKNYKPYMKDIITNLNTNKNILQTQKVDNTTNEFYLSNLEKEISEKGFEVYFKNNKQGFKTEQVTDNLTKEVVIVQEDIEYLKELNDIFSRENEDYKIIIGPLYGKRKFPESIKIVLEAVFTKKHVFDFSGNNALSCDSTNFYERSHYRPISGQKILHTIY